MSDEQGIFLVECFELMDTVEKCLLAAEKGGPDAQSSVRNAFGAIHSLKGNSMYADLPMLVQCCGKVETMLSHPDRSPKIPNVKEFELLFHFIDAVNAFLKQIEGGGHSERALMLWLKGLPS